MEPQREAIGQSEDPNVVPHGPYLIPEIEWARNQEASGIIPMVETRRGTLVGINNSRVPSERVGRQDMAQARIARALSWTFAKGTNGYNIFWNDFFIATTAKRTQARTICRAGNRLLRVMGSGATWHAGFFAPAWPSFLSIASAGELYKPALQVD